MQHRPTPSWHARVPLWRNREEDHDGTEGVRPELDRPGRWHRESDRGKGRRERRPSSPPLIVPVLDRVENSEPPKDGPRNRPYSFAAYGRAGTVWSWSAADWVLPPRIEEN